MARYPGIEGYRAAGRKTGKLFSAIGGGIAAGAGGDTFGASPETATQNSMMAQDASGESNMGSVYRDPGLGGGSGINYPTVNKPNFWIRAFDPQRAAQMDQMGFQSQMAQANNQFDLQRLDRSSENQMKVMDHELLMNSAREVMKRKGFDDNTINQIIQETGVTATNQAEFERRQSEQNVNLARREPGILYGQTKAQMEAPGVVNDASRARTQAQNIENKYGDVKNQLEINTAENRNRQLQMQMEQMGLKFPYETEILKNQARDSGIVPLHGGSVYGLPKGFAENNGLDMFSVSQGQHGTAGNEATINDPKTGQPIKFGSPGIPPLPPQMIPITPQRPGTSTPGIETNGGNEPFAVKLPDGTTRIYRKKNP